MQEYLPLPDDVLEICHSVKATPRLVAHLVLVHDVANKLVRSLHKAFPELEFNSEAVLFGASTHDIGKSLFPEEVFGPGNQHELHVGEILKKFGISEENARFTYTHANWQTDSRVQLEDLIVALADNCWKGKRLAALEEKAVQMISRNSGKETWEVFSILDEILQELAADADRRLAWQAGFPVSRL